MKYEHSEEYKTYQKKSLGDGNIGYSYLYVAETYFCLWVQNGGYIYPENPLDFYMKDYMRPTLGWGAGDPPVYVRRPINTSVKNLMMRKF